MTRRVRPPSSDNRESRQLPPGQEIKLEGDGPFELPMIEDVDLAVGEVLAVMELRTLDGRLVLVPLGFQAIADLHQLTGQALEAIGPDEGDTVQ